MIEKILINHSSYRGWYVWVNLSDMVIPQGYDEKYWEYHNVKETYFLIR